MIRNNDNGINILLSIFSSFLPVVGTTLLCNECAESIYWLRETLVCYSNHAFTIFCKSLHYNGLKRKECHLWVISLCSDEKGGIKPKCFSSSSFSPWDDCDARNFWNAFSDIWRWPWVTPLWMSKRSSHSHDNHSAFNLSWSGLQTCCVYLLL